MENKINLGDKVTVTSCDGLYDTYQSWAELVGSSGYVDKKYPSCMDFTVVAIANHIRNKEVELYLLKSYEGEFIFDNHNKAIEVTCAAALEEKPSEKVEWVNGDECRYVNDINHEYIYIGEHPHGDGHYAFSEDKGVTYIANGYLIEPETKQQREDRERLENGKAFYELMSEIEISIMNPEDHGTPNQWDELRDEWQQVYILQAEKLNYRK